MSIPKSGSKIKMLSDMTFEIITPNRTLYVEASSPQMATEWVQAVENLIRDAPSSRTRPIDSSIFASLPPPTAPAALRWFARLSDAIHTLLDGTAPLNTQTRKLAIVTVAGNGDCALTVLRSILVHVGVRADICTIPADSSILASILDPYDLTVIILNCCFKRNDNIYYSL